MEKLKSRKINYKSWRILPIIFILLLFLGIGFAVVETDLKINSDMTVTSNVFDIHFEDVTSSSKNVTVQNDPTIENPTKITFNIDFDSSDSVYEVYFKVKNDGIYDGNVSSTNYVINSDILDYIDYNVTYADGLEINEKDKLKTGDSELFKMTIKLSDDIGSAWLRDHPDVGTAPTPEDIIANFSGAFSFEIKYIQDSGEGSERKKAELLYEILKAQSPVLDNISSTYVTSTSGINFTTPSSNTNGKGLYIYAGTQSNQYPIYYYRGEITNNNIIFANTCWKILRTTETGGIKLLYNGAVGNNNTCNNIESATILPGTISFNADVQYGGYMYNTNTSSPIKSVVDDWYLSNVKNRGYEKYVEDTIFCNDMNPVVSDGSTNYFRYFVYVYGAYKEKPIVTCENQSARYTVKTTNPIYNASLNGNKKLDYPVGIITADEAHLAGLDSSGAYNNTTTFVHSGSAYWTMTPYYESITTKTNYVYGVTAKGYIGGYTESSVTPGARPLLSLKNDIYVTTTGSGIAGSVTNPYIVSYN